MTVRHISCWLNPPVLTHRPIVFPESGWTAPPTSSFSTAVLLEDVAFLYSPGSCDTLQLAQDKLCDMVEHNQDVQWPSFESEPGWLFIW